MNTTRILALLLLLIIGTTAVTVRADEQPEVAKEDLQDERQTIKALYIPLADHYAGIVAYEKYRDVMKYADFRIEKMKSWPLLRARFLSGEVDVAFIASPMAIDMFHKRPDFRWVSLMHRDGNALAINDMLNSYAMLSEERSERLPDKKVVEALVKAKQKTKKPIQCGVPHLMSTHTVVLYKYLKDHGKTLGLDSGIGSDVVAIEVPPAQSPSFIKKMNSRATPAMFEQSLPWADVVETHGFGKVAWYSKDVIEWKPFGHVECIVVATDDCIKKKRAALSEVIFFLHQAGLDIELSRLEGGLEIIDIAKMVRKHIPDHNTSAIIQSLRPDLNVINYLNLNIDKAGLGQIMDLAVEGGILKEAIDIDDFADSSFTTDVTVLKARILEDLLESSSKVSVSTRHILETAEEMLSSFAMNLIIINAVREQNVRNLSMDEIMKIDRQWRSGSQSEFAMALQENHAGIFLRNEILSGHRLYNEAILCDRHGAAVAVYPKTTDYWQGDEKKFTEAYNRGQGRIFISPLAYDKSTSSYSVHVSVPVIDNGETIGVLILGVRNVK